MQKNRPYTLYINKLTDAGLRPTKQRLGLCRLLFERPNTHITAEQLFELAKKKQLSISLATVYNCLNQFCDAGIVNEIFIAPGHACYCTNPNPHHHIYNETTGEISDICAEKISVALQEQLPETVSLQNIDVILRVKNKTAA